MVIYYGEKYYLKIVDGNVVAMTGLSHDTIFENGMEIDWTCTHPNYRKNGYMHELFSKMIPLTSKNIYCSCWKLDNKENVELHSLMKAFDFQCLSKGYITCDLTKCKFTDIFGCVNYKPNCSCQEDLYIRKNLN